MSSNKELRYIPSQKNKNIVVLNKPTTHLHAGPIYYPITPTPISSNKNESNHSRANNKSSFIDPKHYSQIHPNQYDSRPNMKREASMIERDFIKTLKGVVNNQKSFESTISGQKSSQEVMRSCQKLQRKSPVIPQFSDNNLAPHSKNSSF